MLLLNELDFKIKLITDVLDVKFRGTTDEDKRKFIKKYWKARQEIVALQLGEAFKEMKGAIESD